VLNRNTISIIFITLLITSCDSNRVYENTADINNAYWLADSIKTFKFNILDKSRGYNISFSLRNGVEFPHGNIYVQYIISDSTNNILDEELRNFQLFHPKSGYPFGNGSGNLFEHQFDLLIDYDFPYEGKYNISFQQYMRYDSLPQVYSVGVRVEMPE
jgi:gliding motility-associated lipoprotein GldH